MFSTTKRQIKKQVLSSGNFLSRSFLKINEDGTGNNLQLIYANQMQKCEELGKKDKFWFDKPPSQLSFQKFSRQQLFGTFAQLLNF